VRLAKQLNAQQQIQIHQNIAKMAAQFCTTAGRDVESKDGMPRNRLNIRNQQNEKKDSRTQGLKALLVHPPTYVKLCKTAARATEGSSRQQLGDS
jgi:hypothetical protein